MHDIDWKWCPRVATHEITRNFLISQARLQKARQTLEAYGRDLDDLLEAFSNLPFNDLIEADCGQLEIYIDGLYNRPPKQGASSLSNITRITKTRLSLATIRRRVSTARRFYQWLIDRRLRQDLINPVPMGAKGKSRGPVPATRQDPWIPDDKVWARILQHFLEHECFVTRSCSWSATMEHCGDKNACSYGLRILSTSHSPSKCELKPPKMEKNVWWCSLPSRTRNLISTSPENEVVSSKITEVRKAASFFYRNLIATLGSPFPSGRPGCDKKSAQACRGTRTDATQIASFDAQRSGCGGMELSEVSYYAGHASLATTNLYVHPKRSIVARHVRKATKWRDDQMRRLIEETKPHE